MLCASGKPFDSDKHLFEVKWDGMRTLCFVEGAADGYRLRNRQQRDVLQNYPELGFLAKLPAGLALDGELVLLQDGKPSFRGLMGRQHANDPKRIAAMASSNPVIYAVFDLLYQGFEPTMAETLEDRRKRLQDVVAALGEERLMFSDGVVGNGKAFFEQMRQREFEGIVAKRLDSRYLPGQRTNAWTKIKQSYYIHCLILGYLPAEDDPDDIRSLIIATDEGGELRCIGRVGSGLTDEMRRHLIGLLKPRIRATPLIPCADPGTWVEPGLYCTVSYLEKTAAGLRAPVFVDLVA
ncbi:MAG: ATP-dependent DNA ligase [Planctomycetota bacterium]